MSIDNTRQHEAEPPQDVVERVAAAIDASFYEALKTVPIDQLYTIRFSQAKAAIAAYQHAIFKEPGHE